MVLPTVDFNGASLALGGIMVLLKEQRFTLSLLGPHRSQLPMKGSLELYAGKANSSSFLRRVPVSVLHPEEGWPWVMEQSVLLVP